MTLTLEQLNAATAEQAAQWLDGLYEHSPWIAEAAPIRAATLNSRLSNSRSPSRPRALAHS